MSIDKSHLHVKLWLPCMWQHHLPNSKGSTAKVKSGWPAQQNHVIAQTLAKQGDSTNPGQTGWQLGHFETAWSLLMQTGGQSKTPKNWCSSAGTGLAVAGPLWLVAMAEAPLQVASQLKKWLEPWLAYNVCQTTFYTLLGLEWTHGPINIGSLRIHHVRTYKG